MSDHGVPEPEVARPTGPRPPGWLWIAGRGLIVGSLSLAAGWGAGELFLTATDKGPPPPCDSDLACLPDLRPLIGAVLVALLAVTLAGPLAARLSRLRSPWMFVAPAGAMVALGCVGLDFSPLALALAWMSYAPLAVWVMRRRPIGVLRDDGDH
ncbi:hypothetical protein R8Z50_15890 [Longispora sp. K20-0274]|uniref:hypothetical protein n=1 Tax=Longispora sp. K20-0274 TaxID=3088255 RepID=UPI00399AD3DC